MFRSDPAAQGDAGFRDRFGRFAHVCRTVEAHLAEPELSIDRLAALVAMSRRQLQRDFADNGTSFTQFLAERRVRLTADHLRRAARQGERPAISDIAWRAGFSDLSNFNRTFRSHFGMSPRDYHASVATGAVES
ncbi:helix-turn-helix domain-containing protein [Amaricoccus sp.]|uniref:helix-turn-helix domain-containing protein n=1 Tax=Amaricoccus sp. TaxID=1872485 RepID=UPI001B727A9F|nr:helix-turn-helix domain-containing protein [Amaricoccus sp.]MBP7002190.1 helix-turn-helix domain-containing protein [Amaricoccus sp.]